MIYLTAKHAKDAKIKSPLLLCFFDSLYLVLFAYFAVKFLIGECLRKTNSKNQTPAAVRALYFTRKNN